MGMHLPSWIFLKKFCLEFCPTIVPIITQVGELLEIGKANEVVRYPSFCVALDVDLGQIA
jgi:hypothetical protein